MTNQLLFVSVASALLACIPIIVTAWRWLTPISAQENANDAPIDLSYISHQANMLVQRLTRALPDSVILPTDTAAFKASMKNHWAQQECEVTPACIVRPYTAQELSRAVAIIKVEYDLATRSTNKDKIPVPFAIRGGGHSPVSHAASTRGGVLIDLGRLNRVTPSPDGTTVTIGGGAKWIEVSSSLDKLGLAVVGGRNSAVGVGGLTLGGGLSFFSPLFGMVCSNILNYELVLANGDITTATAAINSDLWRALKGGSNNFGIVTSFIARAFPSSKIWSGFLYMPDWPHSQASNVLRSYHGFTKRKGTAYDEFAAGPLVCFSYIDKLSPLGGKVISVNLVHTKTPDSNKWLACWKSSGFSKPWRLWSTCKVRTLTDATDELNVLNPPGRRQCFATTTIHNDFETLREVHCTYRDIVTRLRLSSIKGLVWTLVLQPLLPDWARKGDPNPLGLDRGTDKPLVIVSLTINWDKTQDDAYMRQTARQAIDRIEAFAKAGDTDHRYKYLNYCADWQRPFEGYGEENLRFLRDVSRKYDPEGLFQKGCTGGFKLGIKDSRAVKDGDMWPAVRYGEKM